MDLHLTAVFRRVAEGYIGFVEELIRHLEEHGCELLREGANHSVYINRASRRTSTVPRHTEINDDLAKKICMRLGVCIGNDLVDFAALE